VFIKKVKIVALARITDTGLDTSDPGHFGTSLVGPNCPDRSALVPKSKDTILNLILEVINTNYSIIRFTTIHESILFLHV